MHRLTHLIVIAAAVAAFVPVAHAAPPVDAGSAEPLPWVNTDIGSIETDPPTWPDIDFPVVVDPQKAITSASDATGSPLSPYPGWIIVADDQGLQWLVPVAYATPSRVRSAAKHRGTLVTDNSPSQNRLARRAAAQRAAHAGALHSALRTFPG